MAEKKTKKAKTASADKKGSREFDSAEDLQECVDEYFAHCDDTGELYDEDGMALWLSAHNSKGKSVTTRTLHAWWDGERAEDLQDNIRLAYMRIAHQIKTDTRYMDKSMQSRAIFLMKQRWYGGYTDKQQEDKDITVNVQFGQNMDASDFK